MDAVTLLSGGMDSAVMLFHLQKVLGMKVHALSFDYGQRHKKELSAAISLASYAKVDHSVIDLTSVGELLKTANSSQTNPNVAVPDGHYAEETMKLTIVPNRNAMMLGIAFSVAVAEGAKIVGFAAHGGDHFIYPDCRPEFIERYESAMHYANDDHDLKILSFFDIDKTEIARRGYELNVPFDLTWSCYKGGRLHCGTCGTCTERKEAFKLAHLDDPTEYE